jgi:hypothetical protein
VHQDVIAGIAGLRLDMLRWIPCPPPITREAVIASTVENADLFEDVVGCPSCHCSKLDGEIVRTNVLLSTLHSMKPSPVPQPTRLFGTYSMHH